MEEEGYRPRTIDARIDEDLSIFGAICVEGPKWCGKTWTSAHHCASTVYVGDPAGDFQNRRLAQTSPDLILSGPSPRLVDEWQEVPPLWDAVRHLVDQRGLKGRFILTGSSTPNHKGILHSGAGRVERLRMRPMSLFESGDSSGAVSLRQVCESGSLDPVATGEVSLLRLAELVVRGGWPANLLVPASRASRLPRAYVKAIVEDDAWRLDGIRRDTFKMELLLRSLARNECTTASNRVLRSDVRQVEGEDLDLGTIAVYLDAFKRLFLLDNQPPFSAKVRSSVRVKQMEKRHLADPSLACALLSITPSMLVGDLETFGLMFESMCERDLKVYAESFDAQLYHYQDYANREADAVVELPDGRWVAIEVKLGANRIDEAAASLLSLRDSIAAEKGGRPPSSLVVLCGLASAAYVRPDGVMVIPITALRE